VVLMNIHVLCVVWMDGRAGGRTSGGQAKQARMHARTRAQRSHARNTQHGKHKARTEKILKEGWWMLQITRRPGRERALRSRQMSSAVLESRPDVGSCSG
jgi:hypothetical protein